LDLGPTSSEQEVAGRQGRAHPSGAAQRCCPRLSLAIFADGYFYHGCPEHGLTGTTPRSPEEARPSASTTALASTLNQPGGSVVPHAASRVVTLHLGPHRRPKNVRHLGQPHKRCPIAGLQNIPEVFRETSPFRKSRRSCLGRPKRLIQIGDDVVHIFDTHR